MMVSYVANLPLPECAMYFNNAYLEQTILGYRTSSVSGREPITITITELESEATDGASFSRKKIPARELTVSFGLVADTQKDLLKKMDDVRYQLYKKDDATIRFKDELDVFYKGTVSKITTSSIDAGSSYGYALTGSITIRCSDPFKYSTKEYTATAQSDGTINITYNGTYKAYPTITATMTNYENGYVAFVNDDKKILQFGNPDEADGTTTNNGEQKLCTLDNLINAADDHGSEVAHPTYGNAGTIGSVKYTTNKHGTNPNKNFLALTSIGNNNKEWNGGMKTFTLPADSSGSTSGSKHFYVYLRPLMWASLMGQTGEMTISFLTSDNKFICGMNFVKNDASGNTAKFETMVYNNAASGSTVRSDYVYKRLSVKTFQANHLRSQNPIYWDWGGVDLTKEGARLTFQFNNQYQTFNVSEIKDMACCKIQVAINYAKNRSTTGSNALYWLGTDFFEFYKMDVAVWKNITNKFAKGSTLKVYCGSGKVMYNNVSKPALGALGNDWEDFCLEPGETNQIKCLYSSWSKLPTCTVTYREVFL